MATLILSTAGAAIAGPIGGAIGAVIGQAADQAIFAPKARHGPRLGDLAVQTSSYGSQLPRIFGTMRVAGTVIWATDLIETRTASGGGKGRPKSVGYSYAANFAVALSARPAGAVRRIWADGKLLRGAAGDFKTRIGGFRFHPGSEDQAADPLIAAAEGIGLAPAYRGLAYAVFEELQLEDYGNRIPSLSFEVEADPGPVALGEIARELSGGAIADGGTPAVAGFAATGDSIRSAVESLADMIPLYLVESDGELALGSAHDPQALLPRRDLDGPAELGRRAAAAVPGEVALTHYDPARDHLPGLQRAFREGPSGRGDSLAVAAAMSAGDAQGFAEARLAALWSARRRAKLRLGWRHLGLRPGAAIRIEGIAGEWAVERATIGPMTVDIETSGLPGSAAEGAPASPGRFLGESDRIHGPTRLRLLDHPIAADGGGARLWAAAAGTEPGWRRAFLSASFDGGASWSDLGPTAAPAVLGTTSTALGPGGAALIDDRSSVDVELLHGDMLLENRSDAALAGGANLAAIGGELVQFGRAERIGDTVYRLSRLLRGRRGTEWASPLHEPGEPFTLIEQGMLLPVAVADGSVGAEARLVAVGLGDTVEGVLASAAVTGDALCPPSPVHLQAVATAGGLDIRWTRRSRLGWPWIDGADAPLAEESERYRVTIAFAGGSRSYEVSEPGFFYSALQQAADGAAPPLALSVVQLGTNGPSRPALAAFG